MVRAADYLRIEKAILAWETAHFREREDRH
jgi:hypothetical protein